MTDLPEFAKDLPGKQYKIFEALFLRRANFVDTSVLIDLLYADDPDGGPLDARKNVSVLLCMLRQRLPADWKIVNVWGRGYRLVHTPPPAPVSQPDISALKAIINKAEQKVGLAQETLTLAAAGLAQVVGPLATAHRLAELALEMADLAEMEAGNG